MRRAAAGVFSVLVAAAPFEASAGGAPWYRAVTSARPDGLEVIVDPVGASVASLRIVVLAGDKHDPEGRAGVAELCGRLVATGTSAEDAGALARRLDRLGARLEVVTGLDGTVIGLDAPAASFDEASKLVLLAIAAPLFSTARIEAAALLRDRAPFSVSGGGWARALELVYGTSPRGPAAPEALGELYRAHYQPGRMVVIATGDVTPAGIARILDQAFLLPARDDAADAAATGAAPALPAEIAAQAAERQLVFGYRACAAGSAESAACYVLGEIARQELSGRLHREVGGGSAVRGGYVELAQEGFVAVQITSGRWKGVKEKAVEVFGGLARRLKAADVARAIAALDARAELRRADPGRLADHYARQAIAGRRDGGALKAVEQEIRRVNASQLAQIARRYFTPEQTITIRLTPTLQR